jgi:hypothetical protein
MEENLIATSNIFSPFLYCKYSKVGKKMTSKGIGQASSLLGISEEKDVKFRLISADNFRVLPVPVFSVSVYSKEVLVDQSMSQAWVPI